MKKFISAVIAGMLCVSMLASCGSVPENTVHSVEDLEGKTIGVQLGTTGDIYATSDVKDATVERFNKGADAVQALKQGKVDAVMIDNEPAKVFVSKTMILRYSTTLLPLRNMLLLLKRKTVSLRRK